MAYRCAVLLALLLALAFASGCKSNEEPNAELSPATPGRIQSAAATKKLSSAQSLARRRPKDLAAQLAAAQLAYDQGAYNDAYRAYKQAAQIDPKSYEAMFGLAQVNLKLQNPTEGLDWLLRAKQLKPGDVQAKSLEANLLLINGNFDRSIAAFNEAIRMDPKRVTTRLNLASAYALMNRPADAVRATREAVKIAPDEAAPHFALGRHLQRANDLSGAEAEYRTALARDAKHAPSMIALARLLMDQNRKLDEARKLAIEASQIRTDRADAALIAAWVLHLQGDDRKCANELIKLVNASPQTPEAWQKLASVLRRIDKPNEAKQAEEMARRFISTQREGSDLQMLGDGE